MPKIRLTIGSILGLVLTAAVGVTDHEALVHAIIDTTGGRLAVLAGGVLALSKAIISYSHTDMPPDKKVVAGPLMFEKTSVFNPYR